MKTVLNNVENVITIKNSKFITNIIKLNSYDDIRINLDMIRNKYKDATHNCYAYVFDNLKKSDDDNEPSKTAGVPMLQVLEKKELTNVLVIVTRYFGGIKLGASGLVRAYTASVVEALGKTEIVSLVTGYNIDIIFGYDKVKKVDYILKDIAIISKVFKDNIRYNVNVDELTLERLKLNNIEIENKKNIYL